MAPPGRVHQVTDITGIGDYNFSGNPNNAFRTFLDVFSPGETVVYCCTDNASNYEIGTGILVSGGGLGGISGRQVILSSNVNALVNWTLSTTLKDIFAWELGSSQYPSAFSGTTRPVTVADWGLCLIYKGATNSVMTLPEFTTTPVGFSFSVFQAGTGTPSLSFALTGGDTWEGGISPAALTPGGYALITLGDVGWIVMEPSATSGSGTVQVGSANQLAYYAGTGNTVSGLATGNWGVLATNGSGVPGISQTPQLGTPSSVTGSLTLASENSIFSVTLAAAPTTTAWTLNLPVTGGSNGQFLQTNGAGVTTWANPSGSGTVNAGTSSELAYYATNGTAVSGLATANFGVLATDGSGVPSISQTPQLGTAGTTAGTLALAPATGTHVVTLAATASTAAWTLSLPPSAGSTNQFLQTDGSGNTVWASPSGTGTINSGTTNELTWYAASGTTVSGLATANNGVLVTSGSGVPSISSTLPTAVQNSIVITNLTAVAGGTLLGNATGTSAAPAASSVPVLGVAGTTAGSLSFAPATGANVVTLAATNSTAAWTLKFPASAGTNLFFLQTDGSGNTTWAAGGSGTVSAGTANQLGYYATSSSTISGLTSGNSSVISTNSSGVPSWGTTLPTFQFAKTYQETKTAPTISGGTLTLDLSTATAFDISNNANITTLTLTNPPSSGIVQSFTMIFTANGTGFSQAWPSSFKFASGTPPTLTITSGKQDVLTAFTRDGGTTYLVFISGQNY